MKSYLKKWKQEKKVVFAFSKMFADERIFPIKKDKSKLCEKNADPFMLKKCL